MRSHDSYFVSFEGMTSLVYSNESQMSSPHQFIQNISYRSKPILVKDKGFFSLAGVPEFKLNLILPRLIQVFSAKIAKTEKHIQKLTFNARHCPQGKNGRRKKSSLITQIDIHQHNIIDYKKCLEKLKQTSAIYRENVENIEVFIYMDRLYPESYLKRSEVKSISLPTGDQHCWAKFKPSFPPLKIIRHSLDSQASTIQTYAIGVIKRNIPIEIVHLGGTSWKVVRFTLDYENSLQMELESIKT